MSNDSIGTDISKDTLDCHRLSDGTFAQFPNTARGFKRLRSWIRPSARNWKPALCANVPFT